jgi:hypothetical protein
MKRVVTALLLIPFFCYIILWAPQWAFLVTVAAVAVLCFREYSELAALHGIAKPGLFGYAAGLLLLLLPGKDEAFFVLVAILGMALALRSREMARALPYSDRCDARWSCGRSILTGCSSRFHSTGRAILRRSTWGGCWAGISLRRT